MPFGSKHTHADTFSRTSLLDVQIGISILSCIWWHYWTKEQKVMAKGTNTSRRWATNTSLGLFLSVFHLYFNSDLYLIYISLFLYLYLLAFEGRWHMQEVDDIVLEKPSKDNGATSQLSEYPRPQYLANLAKLLANTQQLEAKSVEFFLWKFTSTAFANIRFCFNNIKQTCFLFPLHSFFILSSSASYTIYFRKETIII